MKKIFLSLIFLILLIGTVSATGTWTQDLSKDLITSFKLDDNTTNTDVIDSFGINNGTLTNAGNTTNISVGGKIVRAFSFDGVNDYVSMGDKDLVNDSATWSFWIKRSSSQVTKGIITKYLTTGDQASYVIGTSSGGGGIRIYLSTDGSTTYDSGTISGSSYTVDEWTNFVVVFSGGTYLKVYKSGSLISNITIGIPASVFNSSADLQIAHAESTFNYFNGSTDDINIWNRSLTLEEIIDLNSSATYSSVCIIPDINNDFSAQFNNKCHFDSDVDLGTGNIIISSADNGRFVINSNVTAHSQSLTCSAAGCQAILNPNSKLILT